VAILLLPQIIRFIGVHLRLSVAILFLPQIIRFIGVHLRLSVAILFLPQIIWFIRGNSSSPSNHLVHPREFLSKIYLWLR